MTATDLLTIVAVFWALMGVAVTAGWVIDRAVAWVLEPRRRPPAPTTPPVEAKYPR